ncbi:intradiol dioxygenase-like protein [Dinothrombium tinctorium]|uniref:Intradiol dioxygenase-like protein n=1 Tax=Dinothrombium tinctorium TaxID=1965070 RepID=A0A3S3P476_9ACAR|nr:intradiol dioxygenase-like protein [Dinothrombium tinctorium]
MVVLALLFNFVFWYVTLAHPQFGKRQLLQYNSTVIDCSQFNRQEYQHTCVMAPEAIEGPYFIDEDLYRKNITEGKRGIPMDLHLVFTNAKICFPLHEAKVYVWSCDSRGYYSGYTRFNPDSPPPSEDKPPVGDSERFLRGVQRTNLFGKVSFESIIPGFYYGRAVHVHVEVHIHGKVVHIAQLYFDEKLLENVENTPEYSEGRKVNRTKNEEDLYYTRDNGKDSIVNTKVTCKDGKIERIEASMTLGIDPDHERIPIYEF